MTEDQNHSLNKNVPFTYKSLLYKLDDVNLKQTRNVRQSNRGCRNVYDQDVNKSHTYTDDRHCFKKFDNLISDPFGSSIEDGVSNHSNIDFGSSIDYGVSNKSTKDSSSSFAGPSLNVDSVTPLYRDRGEVSSTGTFDIKCDKYSNSIFPGNDRSHIITNSISGRTSDQNYSESICTISGNDSNQPQKTKRSITIEEHTFRRSEIKTTEQVKKVEQKLNENISITIKRLERLKKAAPTSDIEIERATESTDVKSVDKACPFTDALHLTATCKRQQFSIKSQSLETIANRYGLVVHTIKDDGNCMFSAVIDQFRMSGEFRFDKYSLRAAAVDYLRNHPYQTDGSHFASFLSEESWKDYLCRMSRDSEWGDHIILNAITEVTGRKITVLSTLGNATHLSPLDLSVSDDDSVDTLYIGHVSEKHYDSLRPRDWEESWWINGKICRIAKCLEAYTENMPEKVPRPDTENVPQKVPIPDTENMPTKGPRPNAENMPVKVSKPEGSFCIEQNLKPDNVTHMDDMCLIDPSQCIHTGVKACLTSDIHYIDPISRIPVMHLSYIIRQILRSDLYYPQIICPLVLTNADSRMELIHIGSESEGMNVRLINYKSQKSKYSKDKGEISKHILFHNPSTYRIFTNEFEISGAFQNGIQCPGPLLIDTKGIHPGFLRLRIYKPNALHRYTGYAQNINDSWYLCFLAQRICLQEVQKAYSKYVTGVKCSFWPDQAQEWITRDRPTLWPRKEAIENIRKLGCYIVHQHHANSSNKDIEFQFMFSQAEKLLIKDEMTKEMKYCFYVFKTLVEHQTKNLGCKLPTYFLKTSLFYACESIPAETWRNSCGSCVLYMTELLLKWFRDQNLPNYFIKCNNMIDHWNERHLITVVEQIDALRRFPCMVLHLICDDHSLPSWSIDSVMASSKRYKAERDVEWVIENIFNPTTFFILRYWLSTTYNYEFVFDSLNESFEKNLIWSGQDGDFRTFVDTFLLTVNDSRIQNAFNAFLDERLKKTDGNEAMTYGEYLGPEYKGKYEKRLLHVKDIDPWVAIWSFVASLLFRLEYQDGIEILRCLIQKYQKTMETVILDVTKIEDLELKQQIVKSNYATTSELLPRIAFCYNFLCLCYCEINKNENLHEIILQFQDAVEKIPSKYYLLQVSYFWKRLGRADKAKEIEDRWQDIIGLT